jgi:hypothetical protein
MTGLDGKGRRLVDLDMQTIHKAVSDVAADRPVHWDPFFADRIVPAWDEEEEIVDHDDVEILRVNLSAARCSDGAIFHGYDDGSAMLGHLQAVLLNSCSPRPVLVVRHIRERLSKAWRGLADRHPQLTFEEFEGDFDLYQVTERWLKANLAAIESGPKARIDRVERYRGVSTALLEAFRSESRPDQEEFALGMGLSSSALDGILSTPSDLATIGSDAMMQLTERYPHQVAHATLFDRAREILDEVELRAWAQWASTKRDLYARQVLAYVVEGRETRGVFREEGYLGQSGAWEAAARDWRDG